MPNRPFILTLGLAAGCATALAVPVAPMTQAPRALDPIAELRARGPSALADLLVKFDKTTPGAERDALALTIDKVAAQRYATTSRLYWYTDMAAASAAAESAHKPILALRMLGRLDEDLSCANSRLFRATLYSNTDVSAFLRDNFVLYWSSERPAAKVTIDYGDGRKIESTTTGNSAHYVLASDGTVLDVLPGMYAPRPFRAELVKSLALAQTIAKLGPQARTAELRVYHRAAIAAKDAWLATANVSYFPGTEQLASGDAAEIQAMLAQRATVSKAYIEVPQIRAITAGVAMKTISEDDTAGWAALGQKRWEITVAQTDEQRLASTRYVRGRVITPPRILDEPSRALVTAIHNAGPMPSTAETLKVVVDRLEQHMVADSALNELKLRPQIHAFLADQSTAFDEVNDYVYAKVFHAPKSDAWLGLLPRKDFTGIPGDGALLP